ncbi:MAG: hypothetical protein ACK4ND_06665, partial [Cytophagaceae bacterium]
ENRLLNFRDILEDVKEENSGGNSSWGKITLGILTVAAISTGVFLSQNNTPNEIVTAEEPGLSISNSPIAKQESIVELANEPLEQPLVKTPSITKSEQANNPKAGTLKSSVQADSLPHKESKEKTKEELLPVLNKKLEKEDNIQGKPEEVIVNKINRCDTIKLSAVYTTEAACPGEDNGAVSLIKYTGGKEPYAVELQDYAGNAIALSNLKSGKYSLSISDAFNCRSKQVLEIPEKACTKDFSFNPFFGEEWAIPVNKSGGFLRIFDQAGNSCFEKQILSETSLSWNGQCKDGNIKAGYYIFVIKNNDGSLQEGSVTIVR